MNGEVIIENLLPHLQSSWPLIEVVSLAVGFFLVLAGAYSVISKGRQGGINIKKGVIAVVSGVLLLNIISFLHVMSESIFGKASETGLTYTAPGGGDPTSLFITFAVYVVMLVGISGIIYGGILLNRSADDGRLITSAITHFIGGSLAVNIVTFLHMLSASMGATVESAVTRLIG